MAQPLVVNRVVDLTASILNQHIAGVKSCLSRRTTLGHSGKFHTTVFLLVVRLDGEIGRKHAGMTERDFPTRWRSNKDEALHPGPTALAAAQYGPTARSIGRPDAVQRDGDPCNITPYFGHRVLGMIVNVQASVLVQLPALAFVGFEWVRIGLLDYKRVRRVQRIHFVEVVGLDSLLVRENYIYGSLLVVLFVLFGSGARSAGGKQRNDQKRRGKTRADLSLHVDLFSQI